jgi:hypothetical protein
MQVSRCTVSKTNTKKTGGSFVPAGKEREREREREESMSITHIDMRTCIEHKPFNSANSEVLPVDLKPIATRNLQFQRYNADI